MCIESNHTTQCSEEAGFESVSSNRFKMKVNKIVTVISFLIMVKIVMGL